MIHDLGFRVYRDSRVLGLKSIFQGLGFKGADPSQNAEGLFIGFPVELQPNEDIKRV